MQSSSGNDEDLMRQVARGNREPLSLLMRRHANGVLTFLRRMCGSAELSEELFQDVFFAIWTHRRHYEYPRSFRSWIYGIAIRKCRTAFRQRALPALSLEVTGIAAVASRERSPVDVVIATENSVLVEQAVMKLPPVQRSVVVLRIWNGLSYGEIANILGTNESTARSNMFHGLAAMRRYLEPRMR